MKRLIRLSLVIMMSFLLVACGSESETVYNVQDFKKNPELIEEVITEHANNPTEISAKNAETAKEALVELITNNF